MEEFILAKDLHKIIENKGSLEDITKLLNNGIEINNQDEEGRTALYVAVESNQIETTKLLINYKADVNITNTFGNTPLFEASWKGLTDIVKLLIDNKADVNIANEYGETPLHWAIVQNSIEIIELLIKSGANLDVSSNDGGTPLSLAILETTKEVVLLLIENCVDIYQLYKGKSIIDLAENKREIKELLIKSMNRKWTYKTHSQFPKRIRNIIPIMIVLRLRRNCQLSRIPKEILFHICSFIPSSISQISQDKNEIQTKESLMKKQKIK